MSQQKIENQPVQPSPRKVDAVLIVMILAGAALMVFAVVGLISLNRPAAVSPAAPGASAQNAPAGGPVNAVRVGQSLSDFALTGLDGKTVHLSDYKGRWVLVNAWATWCPPCKAEMPQLNALYNQYQQSGFVVLGVNAGETQQQAADFVKELKLQFPIVLDPDLSLMDRLMIRDYPTSILVDKSGLVKGIHIGYFSEDALKREVEPYIKQ